MTRADFEQCIVDAIAGVPEHIREKMENLAFVVEDRVRDPGADEEGIEGDDGTLLGLYQGVPLIHRGPGYQYALPDKITIFQPTIERLGRGDPARIRAIVHDTVLHEIAHHIGFSEMEVRQWEGRRKTRGM